MTLSFLLSLAPNFANDRISILTVTFSPLHD